MQLRYVDAEAAEHPTELLAVAVARGSASTDRHLQALDAALNGAVGRVLDAGDMEGRRSHEVLLYGGGAGPKRVLLLGVGRRDELTPEIVRRMAGRAVRAAERLRIPQLAICLDGLEPVDEEQRAQAAAEGAALAAWRFRELKREEEEDDPIKEVRSVDLLGSGVTERLSAGAMTGAVVGRATNLARTLQSRPGNVATPTHIAEAAARRRRRRAADHHLRRGAHARRGHARDPRGLSRLRGGSPADRPGAPGRGPG
jgi:leucyl aminopeptidase